MRCDAMSEEESCIDWTVHVTSIDWPKNDLITASLTMKQVWGSPSGCQAKKRDLLSTMIFWVARVSCKVTDASLSEHRLDSETYEHRREML